MPLFFEVAGQIGASYFGGKLAVCSANLGARDRSKTKKEQEEEQEEVEEEEDEEAEE